MARPRGPKRIPVKVKMPPKSTVSHLIMILAVVITMRMVMMTVSHLFEVTGNDRR